MLLNGDSREVPFIHENMQNRQCLLHNHVNFILTTNAALMLCGEPSTSTIVSE